MLTQPAEASAHGPCLVHHRLNINTNFSLRLRIMFFDPRKQSAEFSRHNVVIIVAPRIARNFSGRWILFVLMRCVVVERDNYNRSRLRKDLTRADAFFDIARHPRHGAVVTTSQPLFQAPPFFVQQSGADNSDLRESLGECALLDRVSSDFFTTPLLGCQKSRVGLKTHPPMITDYGPV